jgi:Secretion system C-terminal sorting domain
MKNIFLKTFSFISLLSIFSFNIIAADVINEGILIAPGNVGGNLVNNNTIKFGEPAKVLTVNGNFISTTTALLEIVTAGNIPNSIAVNGKTVLSGGIVIKFDPAYLPTIGDVFEVITSTGEITGTFATVTLENLPAGMVWQANYNTNSTSFKIVSATPLPIKLISFDAKAQENQVQLTWKTSSEINSSGFEIERSENGKDFTKIGYVKSDANNGNSNEKLGYSFIDEMPMEGNNFYRLKQLDIDGKFEFSTIKSAKIEDKEAIKIYPNPTSDFINIESNKLSKIKSIELINAKGSIIYKTNLVENKIDMSAQPTGVYFVKIEEASGKIILKKILKN